MASSQPLEVDPMLLLALVAVAAADPPPLTVKLKTPAVGDRYQVAYEATTTVATTLKVMGNAVDQPAPKPLRERRVYTDEVSDWPKEGDGAAAVRRSYSKDEIEGPELPGGGALADLKLKLTADSPGKPVKATTADGSDLSEVARARVGATLDVPFRGWAYYYLPAKPMAVGEEYKLDLEAVAAALVHGQYRWDAGNSSAVAKLVSRNRKDGAEYGRVEVAVDLTLTKQLKGIQIKKDDAAAAEDVETALKDGSKVTLRIVIEGCLDGSRYDLTVTETLTTETCPDLGEAPVEVRTKIEREATDRLGPGDNG